MACLFMLLLMKIIFWRRKLEGFYLKRSPKIFWSLYFLFGQLLSLAVYHITFLSRILICNMSDIKYYSYVLIYYVIIMHIYQDRPVYYSFLSCFLLKSDLIYMLFIFVRTQIAAPLPFLNCISNMCPGEGDTAGQRTIL